MLLQAPDGESLRQWDPACFPIVEHPQKNGQAKSANKVITKRITKKVEELSQVLWNYHTTLYSTTQETPFRLTFDIEAVILVEIREPSPKTALFQHAQNEEEMQVNLDLLQEAHEVAHIKEYATKACVAR
ncbi:hypothetical protein CR513_44906, partial [Mucuna pruriens]